MAVAPGKAAAQAAVTKDLPLHLKGLRATWGVHGLVLGTAAKLLGKGKPLQAPVLPTRRVCLQSLDRKIAIHSPVLRPVAAPLLFCSLECFSPPCREI